MFVCVFVQWLTSVGQLLLVLYQKRVVGVLVDAEGILLSRLHSLISNQLNLQWRENYELPAVKVCIHFLGNLYLNLKFKFHLSRDG